MIDNFEHTDTEENAAKLQKEVVDTVKEVTDVVVSSGGWKQGGPLLQQSVDFLMELSGIRASPEPFSITISSQCTVYWCE